jgi:hypothetical protein
MSHENIKESCISGLWQVSYFSGKDMNKILKGTGEKKQKLYDTPL